MGGDPVSDIHYAIIYVIAILTFAWWLENRDKCETKIRRSNPYDLIDHQEKMRREREKKNEDR